MKRHIAGVSYREVKDKIPNENLDTKIRSLAELHNGEQYNEGFLMNKEPVKWERDLEFEFPSRESAKIFEKAAKKIGGLKILSHLECEEGIIFHRK